jgi:hypothetical protein
LIAIYPNIRNLVSLTVFDKCGVTLGAPNLNAPFAPRDTNLLTAGRALVDMVGLALMHQVFLLVEGSPQLVCPIQIPLIFRRTLVNIPGKHAKIGINDTCPGHKRQNYAVAPACQNHGDKSCNDGKFTQRIHSITTVHKSN